MIDGKLNVGRIPPFFDSIIKIKQQAKTIMYALTKDRNITGIVLTYTVDGYDWMVRYITGVYVP